jgi:excinuclease ABC subunit C
MVTKQSVHEHLGKNRDVWAFSEGAEGLRIVVLTFRKGILIGKRQLHYRNVAAPLGEAISSFMFQYYETRPIPDEIILSESPDDLDILERHLKEKRKNSLKVYGPESRLAKEMIGLAIENLHEPEQVRMDEAFRGALHLRSLPNRIEAYDISHTHGKNPSGVMVVFEGFKTAKSNYRVFHIRGDATMDDVAMISEVLRRRMTDPNITPFPDLIIIDGGKGHLSAARRVLKDLNIDIDAISIAKDPRRRRMEDLIYLPARKNPLPIPRTSQVLKEIVKMRDEAHRFAISSHKRWKRREDLEEGKRSKGGTRSEPV